MTVRRVFTKILIVLLAFITAVLAVRAVLNYTTGKRLERYLAQAKAEGIPLRIEDVISRCPDADNGARPWKAAEALFVLPERNERQLAADVINGFYEGRSLNDEARRILGPLCERNRRIFELIAETGAKPCFRYGDWTKGPWSIEMMNAVKSIQATRLMGIDAVLRSGAEHMGPALDEVRVGLHFVQKLTEEPLLINCLVALAETKAFIACFQQIASGSELDEATLSAWMKEMDAVSWRHSFIRWIPTERAVGLDWGLLSVGGGPGGLSSALTYIDDDRGIDRILYWLMRPIIKSQTIWAHRRYRELEKVIDEPYYRQIELFEELGRAPWYFRASGLLLPEFRSAFLKEASLEALMLATQAGLACKIYKAKTGRYPENLEALVPDILPEVPIDPFTGKPLVFKITDGQLLIYSVGSNQRDDGGRSSAITQMVMEKDDDWAWRETIAEKPPK